MRSSLKYMVGAEMKELQNVLQDMAREVYTHLGSGFDESIYQSAFAYELRQRGFHFQREVNIEIFYKGIPLGLGRPDFIIRPCTVGALHIEKPIIVELKAVDRLNDNHRAQLRAYLISIKHSSDLELRTCIGGFLINFPKNYREPEIVPILDT